MTNNLKTLQKDLRSFAKRHKNFKYTDSALITFLITGMIFSVKNAFSEGENTNIEKQKQEISKSIKDIHQNFKRAKAENNKLLKNTNIELIQLMEQGDHVTKSPWSSWQYGINNFYNDWHGTYKGRGNKTDNIIYTRDKNAKMSGDTHFGAKYGATNLARLVEPIAFIPIDAGVVPKNISKTALNINLPVIGTPATPQLNVRVSDPLQVTTINPTLPNIIPSTPSPNLNPFSDFTFLNGFWNRSGMGDNGKTFWAGYNPYSNNYTQGFGNNMLTNNTASSSERTGVLIYLTNGAPTYSGVTVHVAGNTGGAGKVGTTTSTSLGGTALDGRVISQNASNSTHNGQIAFHLFGKNTVTNSTINMYGKANAFSLETWQMHDWSFSGVKVNIIDKGIENEATNQKGLSDENIIFNIYPSYYETTTGFTAHTLTNRNRGKFNGDVNADLTTRYNIVYSVVGNAGSFGIDNNHGMYNLEGSKNTLYSGLGYQANYGAFASSLTNNASTNGSQHTLAGMKPYINFDSNKISSSGDGNIVMFFAPNTVTDIAPYWAATQTFAETSPEKKAWNKSVIGIYQGEIKTGAKIGTELSKNGGTTAQTIQGNTGTRSDSNQWVEKNVGILAASGQRTGISSQNDLGADAGARTRNIPFSQDVIHSLQINGADFKFGKYSKNGVMIAAQNGTEVDVLMSTNLQDVQDSGGNKVTQITQTKLTDYGVSGAAPTSAVDDTTNEAATGTIIALAQGKWSDATGNLSSMSSNTVTNLKNLSSTINIGQDVEMSARYHKFVYGKADVEEIYPIAYAATKGGIVNAEKTTKALGYGSIIAYASGVNGDTKAGSEVNLKGNVTAQDANAANDDDTKKLKWTNVGGYAKDGGIVNFGTSKNAITTVINGLGAYADGEGSTVNMYGTNTTINTGVAGALVAKDKGAINFGGGTITHKDNLTLAADNKNDHDNTTPFYATTDGQIKFNGATTLDMHDGILITGTNTDYSKTIDNKSKYQGLNNVTVNIHGHNVTLGSFDGLDLEWDDKTDSKQTYQNGLPGISKFAGGKVNLISNATYKSILVNGTLKVSATNVDLNDSSDLYNGIQMGNEMVTIKNTTTVTGNIGSTGLVGKGEAQGLSMGNIATSIQVSAGITPSNATSGFVNEGTVNVTGGTAAQGIAGINVSYGTIQNKNSVTIDNGAGLYGTNGSKLVNEKTGTVTVSTSGVGIAGIGTGATVQTYGTDDTGTGPTVEIENHGTINVAGDKAIAIFAKNNTGVARNQVTVVNDHQLTVGKEGVGIAIVSEKSASGTENGGILTAMASGTGSDITAGIEGKGIFAKNSDVNLTGGDYVIETQDDGVGIFASGETNVTGTLEYKYTGNTSKTGMGIIYDQTDTNGNLVNVTNSANIKLNNASGTAGGIIGIYTLSTGKDLINTGTITGTSSAKEFGIVTNGANVINKGTITLSNATSQSDANVGIYAKGSSKIINEGIITTGKNAIGIYGYGVTNSGTINTGDNGTAIYTVGNGTNPLENVNLTSASIVNVGENQSVGVYVVGKDQTVTADSGSQFNIGKDSFGFVNAGQGNTITSNANPVTLKGDAIYIYQNDNTGKVFNNTVLVSTGDRNYGLYGNGIIENAGNIDFVTGVGNVAIYSTGGTATNRGLIKVGGTNLQNKEFGIGMATGYYDKHAANPYSNQGTIINKGTIEVSQANSMGMYAVGPSSKAVNYGDINLSGNNTIGMYLDRGAHGENWGTIQTTVSGLKEVKGIYLANGSYIKNYGTINIQASDAKSAGIWTDKESSENVEENALNPLTNRRGTSTPATKVVTATDMKEMGGVTIKVPPAATPVTVTDAKGNVLPIVNVDTNVSSPAPTMVNVTSPSGVTALDLSTLKVGNSSMLNYPSASQANTIGMYVDTSGINYTNPIQGIENLGRLSDINLYFGTEVARYTTSKVIQVGDNILTPYNDALSRVVTAGTMLNVTSSSLTWMAQPTKDPVTGLLDKVYLVKVPYTALAQKGDENTYNFLTGLEQRYGAEGIGTRENEIFQKLNDLGKGEGHIMAQAIDEMKGHQYGSLQQRINATGNVLDKEFSYLKNEWRNPSKQNNKIKLFSSRNEYNTDTAGIVDYTNNAYGVAYVHENEKIKMGNSSGWYAGAVINRYRFKDLGKSKENQSMFKAGVFKTMSPKKDHNGALQWTVSGDIFAGINNIKRRYLVVDEVFEAKSDYNSYGAAIKNEFSYDIRMSERTHLRPYGSLKMEYGRFNGIKENIGQLKLEVKGNDYFSIKPEAGIEFKYVQPLAVKTNLSVGVSAAYENEIGKLQNSNQARLRNTTADWYNLEKEKEDRRGNSKFDLNIGVDNTRFGITVNGGYDTKAKNVRAGIGFRAIY